MNLLPKEQQETFFYLKAFQRRGQSCSFPHLPDEFTEIEVQRFLNNVKENSEQHPEMLALLFATLAQGIQTGVYDKYGGAWHGGMMEQECRLGNAFGEPSAFCQVFLGINMLQLLPRCNVSGLLRCAVVQSC